MKGLVFREFIDMVEDEVGLETVETMFDHVCPASEGAYSAVGTYDHEELIAYVSFLSQKTGISACELQRLFGRHLLGRFVENYGHFFAGPKNAFDFLATIDSTIHVEVRKLYSDAELPRFECERPDADSMLMTYRSSRPFAALALGLIEAAADHYGETLTIEQEDQSIDGQTVVRFRLQRAA